MNINMFIDDNINPLFKSFSHAYKTCDLKGAGEIYAKIEEEIKTAAVLFPKENIEALKKHQLKLWEKIDSVGKPLIRPNEMNNYPPIGIPRTGNDCWAISILQMVANAPGIARKVLGLRNGSCEKLAPLLQEYYQSQIGSKGSSGIKSKEIRDALISKTDNHQWDAQEGLQSLLQKLKFGFQIFEEFSDGTEREQKVFETMVSVNIDENQTFNELFASYFSPTILEDRRTKTTKFEQAPQDLIVHIKRYGEKHDIDIENTPETFLLPKDYTRYEDSNIQYELTSCIIHLGGDNRGHYVTVLKKADRWYLANDSIVSEISSSDAQEWLKKGYLYHYKKVKPSRTCGGLIDVINKATSSIFKVFSYPTAFVNWWTKKEK